MDDAIQNFFKSFQPLYNQNKYKVDDNFKHDVRQILIGFFFQDAQKYYFNLPNLEQVLNYDNYETTNFGRGLRSSKEKATRKLNENEQNFFKKVFKIIQEDKENDSKPLKPIKLNDPYVPHVPSDDLVPFSLPDLVPFSLPMVRYWLNDDDIQPNLVSDLSKFPPLSPSQSPKKDIEKFINESSFMHSLPRSFVSSVASLGTEYGNPQKQMKSLPIKKSQKKKRKSKIKSQEKKSKFVKLESQDSDVMIEESNDDYYSDDTIIVSDSH